MGRSFLGTACYLLFCDILCGSCRSGLHQAMRAECMGIFQDLSGMASKLAPKVYIQQPKLKMQPPHETVVPKAGKQICCWVHCPRCFGHLQQEAIDYRGQPC